MDAYNFPECVEIDYEKLPLNINSHENYNGKEHETPSQSVNDWPLEVQQILT